MSRAGGTMRIALLAALCTAWAYSACSQSAAANGSGEPTAQETVEFIYGKIISLAPHDGMHNYTDESGSIGSCTIRLGEDHSKAVSNSSLTNINFGWLEPTGLAWEVVGTTDQNKKILLTLVSRSGHHAIWQNGYRNGDDYSDDLPSFTLEFSFVKAAEIPDFQKRMTEAVKHLISLC